MDIAGIRIRLKETLDKELDDALAAQKQELEKLYGEKLTQKNESIDKLKRAVEYLKFYDSLGSHAIMCLNLRDSLGGWAVVWEAMSKKGGQLPESYIPLEKILSMDSLEAEKVKMDGSLVEIHRIAQFEDKYNIDARNIRAIVDKIMKDPDLILNSKSL